MKKMIKKIKRLFVRPSIRFYIKRTKTKGRYYLKAIGANNECLFVSGLGSKEKIMAILEYFELFVTEYDGSLNYTELHIATNRHKIVPFIDYSNDNKPYIVFQATKKYYASNGFTIMPGDHLAHSETYESKQAAKELGTLFNDYAKKYK